MLDAEAGQMQRKRKMIAFDVAQTSAPSAPLPSSGEAVPGGER